MSNRADKSERRSTAALPPTEDIPPHSLHSDSASGKHPSGDVDRSGDDSRGKKRSRIQDLFSDGIENPDGLGATEAAPSTATQPELTPESPTTAETISTSQPVHLATTADGLEEKLDQPDGHAAPLTAAATSTANFPLVEPVGSSEMIWQSLQEEHPIASIELIDGQTLAAVLTYSRPFTSGAIDRSGAPASQAFDESSAPASGVASASKALLARQETLLVQLIEEDNLNRIWSEDEIMLVEQVTDQLSLALQNAQLYQESRSRAEQLAILNEMSRKLSEQLDVEQVCHTVYRYTAVLIDATVFYIALNIKETRQVEFPLRVENGQITPAYRREYLNGLTEYIFEHGRPLLIPSNLADFITKTLGISMVGPVAQSWLGVPMIYSDEVTGVIALQSYTQSNFYTPEHRDLLTAIANQAAVAIQNARLYTEEQRRRQIADSLSDIARAVSSGLNVSDISEQVLVQLSKLIPFHSASLQLIDTSGSRQTIARRSAFSEGISKADANALPLPEPTAAGRATAAEIFERPIQADPLIRQVVETRQPVLLVDTQTDPRWEVQPETEAIRCWMAAPLLAAEEVVGLLIIDHQQPGAYNAASVELLTTVCAQVAVGIQNARLFQQTRSAFNALEVSERYQKAVASATSVLTERGIAALSDVLLTLGEAARVSRAFYFETQVDQRGPYWRLIAEWHTPETPSQINNPALRRLSTRFIAPWIDELRKAGSIAAPLTDLSAEIQAFFQPLGTQSTLQFAVPGRHEMPGCIGFEQLDYPRRWSPDEVAALQTAAASLANTIAREDLFTQVQINLAETEALYQASARLNSAGSFDDILTVLRQHSILGHMNASSVSINLFDRAWTLSDKPDWLIPMARWSARSGGAIGTVRVASIYAAMPSTAAEDSSRQEAESSPLQNGGAPPISRSQAESTDQSQPQTLPAVQASLNARYPIAEWSTAEQLLHPDRPVAISDIATDPRIDETGRKIYFERMSAKSLLYAPLNVAGRWIGHIVGIYRQTTGFPESELRRLMSMAGQAAVAVQNLHLLEEASRRARQLQTAAEVARDTSGTLALEVLLNRVVNLLRERFDYYHVSIFLVEEGSKDDDTVPVTEALPSTAAVSSTADQRLAVVYESTGQAGEELKRRRHSLAVGSRSVIGQATALGQAVVLNDLNEESAKAIHRPNPLLPLTQAELGMPLKAGERVIGALDVQSTRPNAFPPEDVAVLQILTDQIAVAVENARSYALAQQAAEELREADRLKSQFLANMSHELRTPLNSIIGFSRVILKGIDGPINELQTQDLSAIYNSGQHLLGLINDVLDLSKIEAGKMELAFEEGVKLADIIRGVMSATVGLVKDKPVELRQEVDPDLPLLRIDSMKIRQVLINFLSNAAKFTERGSITVQANKQVSAGREAEVIVKVIDTGPGIALQDQSKLFQAFSQVDGSLTRKVGGSGLGLSICQHLIQMHGGRVGLESEVGKGSTFFFTLPLGAPVELAAPQEAASQAGAKAELSETAPSRSALPQTVVTQPASQSEGLSNIAGATLGGLILAVDKDPKVIDVYKRWLAGSNFTVIALTELQQVVTVARGLQPTTITLDISMQASGPTPTTIMDGWSVLKELKSDPGTRDIPVIICSLQAEQDKALRMGAAQYLLKPILEDDLLQALKAAQEQRAAQQQQATKRR